MDVSATNLSLSGTIGPPTTKKKLLIEPKSETDDESNRKKKQKDGRPACPAHPVRVAAPSPTQLHLMRTIVRALFDTKSEATQSRGFFTKRDLEKEDVERLEAFYGTSFKFPALLDFSGILSGLGDLSELWYREFYVSSTTKNNSKAARLASPFRVAPIDCAAFFLDSAIDAHCLVPWLHDGLSLLLSSMSALWNYYK